MRKRDRCGAHRGSLEAGGECIVLERHRHARRAHNLGGGRARMSVFRHLTHARARRYQGAVAIGQNRQAEARHAAAPAAIAATASSTASYATTTSAASAASAAAAAAAFDASKDLVQVAAPKRIVHL